MSSNDSTLESESPEIAKPPASKGSTIVLGLLALPALAAALCGATALLAALFPGPSGEWAGLPVFIASCVAVPIGIVELVIAGWFARTPSGLRRFVLVASVLALALPLAGLLVIRLQR
jgi:hypothetical protein